MTKRFSLVLTDHDYYEFLRAFPDYGERTSLLRKAVRQLVKRAMLAENSISNDVADSIFETDYKNGEKEE